MSDRDLPPPLAPELRLLIEDEKARPEPASDAQARLFSRLSASIGELPPGNGDGGEGGEGGAGGAIGAAAAGVRGKTTFLARLLTHPVALAGSTFALGGVLGVALDRALAVPPKIVEPQIVYVDRVVPAHTGAPSISMPSESSTAPSAGVPKPLAARVELRSPDAGAAAERDVQLAGERALLEIAKTALGRGDYSAALETLDRHAKKYPRAQLAEEREALAIQSMVGLGRVGEARVRGERFKKAFPGSMLLPVVESALR